jgi:hypothetical protein
MYRDGGSGLEREIAKLRDDARAFLARLPGPSRFVLDPALLRQLVGAVEGPFFSRDDPGREVEGLGAMLSQTRAALAASTEIPAFELVWTGEPMPLAFEEPYQLQARAELERDVRALDPDVRIERAGDRGYGAFLTYHGRPILHVIRVPDYTTNDDGELTSITWEQKATIGVPVTLPAFAVRREGTWDRVKAGLGLASEVRVGNPAVDERFWIAGPPDLIEALFATDLDAMLLAFPTLVSVTHERGKLDVVWNGQGEAQRAYELLSRMATGLTPP